MTDWPIVYGTSRVRRHEWRQWGWYGWVRWPLSTSGWHYSGHRFPFRWMARRQARSMARAAGPGAVPATADQVYDQEVAGCDTLPWSRPIDWRYKR